MLHFDVDFLNPNGFIRNIFTSKGWFVIEALSNAIRQNGVGVKAYKNILLRFSVGLQKIYCN